MQTCGLRINAMRVMHALAVEIAWLLSATYNLGRMQKKFSAPLEA